MRLSASAASAVVIVLVVSVISHIVQSLDQTEAICSSIQSKRFMNNNLSMANTFWHMYNPKQKYFSQEKQNTHSVKEIEIDSKYSYRHSCTKYDLMYFKSVVFSSLYCQTIRDTTITVTSHGHPHVDPGLHVHHQSITMSQCNSNALLGTCGSPQWTDSNGLKNQQLCITDWVPEGKVAIPYCGPSNQLCVIVGVKRKTSGKPLGCTVESYLDEENAGRTWVMAVGGGCECKAACYNAENLNYKVLPPVDFVRGSSAPICFLNTIGLANAKESCSISRDLSSNKWVLDGNQNDCSGRCYSQKWNYLKGLTYVEQDGRLLRAHKVCFLSSVQQQDLEPAECQIETINGKWWFTKHGFNCQAMCNCDPTWVNCEQL